MATLFSAIAIVGCGSNEHAISGRVAVAGAVTFENKPLPAGTITFKSASDGTTTATSIQNGSYSTDRAPLGKNTVTIDTFSIQYGNPAAFVSIPAAYGDPATSELSAELKDVENTNIDFELSKRATN